MAYYFFLLIFFFRNLQFGKIQFQLGVMLLYTWMSHRKTRFFSSLRHSVAITRHNSSIGFDNMKTSHAESHFQSIRCKMLTCANEQHDTILLTSCCTHHAIPNIARIHLIIAMLKHFTCFVLKLITLLNAFLAQDFNYKYRP